jgi:hypothetical protein
VQIMPFETQRPAVQPFDLTGAPHGDYPLHGRPVTRSQRQRYHAQMSGRVRAEQHRARHRSEPDKMLRPWVLVFDAHAAGSG